MKRVVFSVLGVTIGAAAFAGGFAAAVRKPDYNNPDFTPRHDVPVLYVHGIHSNRSAFYDSAQELQSRGYWVWAHDYGKMFFPGLYGTGELDDMVAQLARNIDDVVETTGSPRVDIIAHSQGGNLVKLYMHAHGPEKVRRVVAMGSPFHGTDVNGMARWFNPVIARFPKLLKLVASPSAVQQLTGSPMEIGLDSIPDTHPGVTYTSLYSRREHLATPTSTSILKAVDGADVVNYEIPGAPLHPLMPHDPECIKLSLWGLERGAGETQPPARYGV